MLINYDKTKRYLRRTGTDEIYIWTEYISKLSGLEEWIPEEGEIGVGAHSKANLRKDRIREAMNKIPKEKWAKKFGAKPPMPKIADLRKFGYEDITLEEVLEVLKDDETPVKAESTEPAE